MCVALPMEVIGIQGTRGRVSVLGAEQEVGLELVEGVALGDFVIVHAGYAIQVLPPAEARERLSFFDQIFEVLGNRPLGDQEDG